MLDNTDDADHMIYGCNTFDDCPVGDRDIMLDEHAMACGRPRCGGPLYQCGRDGRSYQVGGCEGCRHCDPVDSESKPYGWGIERFEREEILHRARQMIFWWSQAVGPLTWERARRLAFAWSDYDVELERQSELAWRGLCDICQTNRDAVQRYGDWCQRRGLKRNDRA